MTPDEFKKATELHAQITDMDKRLAVLADIPFSAVGLGEGGEVLGHISSKLGIDDDYLTDICKRAIRQDMEDKKERLWEEIRSLGIEIETQAYRGAKGITLLR